MVLRRRAKSRLVWMSMGLGVGLLFGVGMLVGVLATFGGRTLSLPATALNASATHGNESFAIATGMIGDGVEGVFFLDFVTGDLQCWVINRRNGTLGGQFKHNVFQDLQVEQGKLPKLLMVTGQTTFSRGSGSVRLADSIVYIADGNTGRFVAYSLPWNQTAIAAGQTQFNRMVLVGRGAVRDTTLRD